MLGDSQLVYTVAAAVVLGLVVLILQYKRCPEGKLLVVYGAHLPDAFVVLDSGGRFVLPLVQQSAYLSLAPIELAERRGPGYPRAVRIGSTAALRRNAALQLIGLSDAEIAAKVEKILKQPDSSARLLGQRLAELGLEIV